MSCLFELVVNRPRLWRQIEDLVKRFDYCFQLLLRTLETIPEKERTGVLHFWRQWVRTPKQYRQYLLSQFPDYVKKYISKLPCVDDYLPGAEQFCRELTNYG